MKKFMRIALVFALAGATLVGCTKDYSGDISDLNKKVTEQASTLSALQTQVGAAQTAADAAAQKAAEALAEAQKKASSADVQAAEERVNAKINDLVNGDVKALKDAVAALEGIKADERLTALETAIKDFVTKAEFAQELAALKDELEDAIAAGDKLNADAIAKLEEKVEGILASLSINSVKVLGDYKGITAAYGKFTAKGVTNAAKWKGPKAAEIAKIKKGDFVFGTGANEIRVQVNPADADITDAEISLQTSECTEAPIAFGTPVPYEGKLTKSENGLWKLPFVVEEFTEEEAGKITKEFTGAAMALVVNGVRTDYDMTFKIDEGKTTDAKPDDITEKVAEASGKGTFVFEPAYAPQILDAYITGVKVAADSLRYGITYDGMSFTYDVEKVQKRVEATKTDVVITFKVSYMNLVGGVCDGKTAKEVKLTIERKAADPVAATVYQFAAEAAHDAVAFHGTTPAQIEASKAEQTLVVDFKEFFDEFAPTKAEKDVWVQDWKPQTAVAKFYKAIYDDYDQLKEGTEVAALVETSGFDRTNSKFNIQFAEDYGDDAVAKLNGKDRFVAEITFKNGDDRICALVPFKINAPSATEIAKWYDWNNEGRFANGVLYANTYTSSGKKYVRLAENFRAKGDYDVAFAPQILTKYDEDGETVLYKYPAPIVKTGCSPAVATRTKNMSTAQKLEYFAGSANYLSDLNDDFNAVKWNESGTGNVNLKTEGASVDEDEEVVVEPYQVVTGTNTPTSITNLTLSLNYTNATAKEYLNRTMQIGGLTVEAMGRIFSIPDLDFQIVGQAPEASCSIEFTKAVELGRAHNTLIDLYHAMYTPNHEPGAYFGAFTLKDENGQALKLQNETNPTSVRVATSLNADGTPNWKNTNNLISISAFDYSSQIDANGQVTPVYGLEIANQNGTGLDNLLPSEDTIYVEITYSAGDLNYVLTNNAYQRTYIAVFEIKVK